MKMGRHRNIIFLRNLAALGTFPPIVSEIRDARSGERVFVQAPGHPWDSTVKSLALQDVPEYFQIHWAGSGTYLRTRTLATQWTYVVDLDGHRDCEAYLQAHFGSKSRSSLRRYKKRLENCFSIQYQVHFGAMDPESYGQLFNRLAELMAKRFEQKGERNYELQHLDEIKQDVYAKLKEKQASIFVIRANGKTISIRVNLMCGKLAYYILSAFDPAYDMFRIGKLDMWQNIQWLMDNGFEKYDLLKGYAYIKETWADSRYANNLVLIGLDPSPWGRMGFAWTYWRKKIVVLALGAAKYHSLDKIAKKWRERLAAKGTGGRPALVPLPCQQLGSGNFRALGDPEDRLDRTLFTLAYRHNFPVAQIKVYRNGDDPDQFHIGIGQYCYHLNFNQNFPL